MPLPLFSSRVSGTWIRTLQLRITNQLFYKLCHHCLVPLFSRCARWLMIQTLKLNIRCQLFYQLCYLPPRLLLVTNLSIIISDRHGSIVEIRTCFSEEDEVKKGRDRLSVDIDEGHADLILEILLHSVKFLIGCYFITLARIQNISAFLFKLLRD